MSPPGIEQASPCFPACLSNHSAIGTVNDMLLSFLHYVFTLPSLNTCVYASMKFIMERFVHTTFCKQQKIIYIFVIAMQIVSDSQFQYTSNQNQFHTCIAIRVDLIVA